MEHIKLFNKCLYMYQVTILSLNFVAMETIFDNIKESTSVFEAGLDCQNVYNPNIRQIN